MTPEPGSRLTRADLSRLPVLCTDGAWGTELMKLGGKAGEVKEVWNLAAPDRVLAVARSYVDAGSRIILTNTFSANRIALAVHDVGEDPALINRAGAEISKRAAEGKAWVFASIGPTGRMVSLGDLDPDVAEEAFAEQARALAEGGADAIVIETQADLQEARAAIRGSLRASDLPVGVTFTFDSGKDSTRTMMGVTVAQAVELATSEGAAFVGANCGIGLDSYVGVARLFADCQSDLPIWIKGNAGKPELGADGRPVYRASPEDFAAAVGPLLDAGVRFVGGCCGSTPDHIRALVRAVASRGSA